MGFEIKRFLKLYKCCQYCALYSEQFVLEQDEESPEIKLPINYIFAIGISYSANAGPDIEITFDDHDKIDNNEAVWFEWDGDGQCNPATTGIRFINGAEASIITLTIKVGF